MTTTLLPPTMDQIRQVFFQEDLRLAQLTPEERMHESERHAAISRTDPISLLSPSA